TGRSLYQSFSTGSAAATIQGFKFSFGYVGTPTTIGLSVYSDINGGVGSSLGSFTAVDPSSLGSGYGSYDFSGSLGVNANSNYWLVLSATGGFDREGNYVWEEQNYVSITSDPDQTGMTGWTLANSHWDGNHLLFAQGGFGEYGGNPIKVEITGAPVPEPSVACLLGLGLGALAIVRRRARA
ncbi:MAG: choice-of-anchor R domain-containing protein, partial [Verrucomicrobiota bacterium]